MDVTVEMPTMDTNGFMKTISQMRPALFTRLEDWTTELFALQSMCAKIVSQAVALALFLTNTEFTTLTSLAQYQESKL